MEERNVPEEAKEGQPPVPEFEPNFGGEDANAPVDGEDSKEKDATDYSDRRRGG